jgi:hypothetical protein
LSLRAREEYAQQAANYQHWLDGVQDKNPVVIAMGVGFNTPGVIRWPFERLVKIHEDVSFFRINRNYRCLCELFLTPCLPQEVFGREDRGFFITLVQKDCV